MHSDPRITVICEVMAQAMYDLTAHGYSRVEAPWELRCLDNSKVVDRGMVCVERRDNLVCVITVTDMYTDVAG